MRLQGGRLLGVPEKEGAQRFYVGVRDEVGNGVVKDCGVSVQAGKEKRVEREERDVFVSHMKEVRGCGVEEGEGTLVGKGEIKAISPNRKQLTLMNGKIVLIQECTRIFYSNASNVKAL